jgi:uncharacterized protein YegP (UPF0339 family)
LIRLLLPRWTEIPGYFHYYGWNVSSHRVANNKTIGTREMYNTQQVKENGIQAIKIVGPTAPINDQT